MRFIFTLFVLAALSCDALSAECEIKPSDLTKQLLPEQLSTLLKTGRLEIMGIFDGIVFIKVDGQLFMYKP